ncbi:TraB/GumN family protein [Alteromonas mediterranea]|uniref:TraB/GumN family protein n=1 Tax=Alteromonas mediterranea TaxID=314275 RepID=UPI0011307A2A|nr:TraB/GumN family protein [Alteromonas mediterranea]QDG39940.1 TraB/GumN family protein [Alteromonas mediterranea]
MKNFSIHKLLFSLGLAVSSVTTAVADTDSQTSVWKVSNGEDAVYVGGTIHILPISEFPLPSEFTDIYEQADTLVFEVKMPDPSDIEGQKKMMAGLAYAEGKSLKDDVSEETYQALNAYLSNFGATADQLARFKPGMVASMLVAMEAQRSQMAGQGVDAYFMQLAARDGKASEYLESLDFQINMFANMGAGEEDRLISETLETLPELKDMLKSTIKAWREGDTEQIDELVVDTFKRESPTSYDDVFTKRNQNWLPQIEAMFGDEDQEFVLVGAGHLVGDDSVIALLEAKGYKVEQM